MGNIIYNNSNIIEFNNNDREVLIDYIKDSGIKYNLYNDNIVIFPNLFNKTLILKALMENEQEKVLIKYLKNSLLSEGATVILDEDLNNNSYLKYIDAQLLILFSFVESYDDLTIYLPFKSNKLSVLITKQLLKQLNILDTKIKYKISTTWSKLNKIKYWHYLFNNSTSIVILEISNSALSKNILSDFESVLVKSIIKELGNPYNENINEVISKIKSYKNNLDDSKKNQTLNTNKKSNINMKNKKEIMYLPKTSIYNINQKESNEILPCPIMYPGEGPVYEFQRPIPNTTSLQSECTTKDILKSPQDQYKYKSLEEKLDILSIKIDSYTNGLDELKQSHIEAENKNIQNTLNYKDYSPQLHYPITFPEEYILYTDWFNYYYRYMWYYYPPITYSGK